MRREKVILFVYLNLLVDLRGRARWSVAVIACDDGVGVEKEDGKIRVRERDYLSL